MDALSVLREFTVRQELGNVHRVGDEFRFGDDYRFPCSTETGYRSKQGPLYNLDCLVFFVKSSALKHVEYLQQARALKLQIVTYPDRKPLLDYLEGRVSSSDAIELLPIPAVAAASAAAAAGDEQHPHPGLDELDQRCVRQKREQKPADASLMIELVRSMERPVRDRDTILLCPNKSFDSILASLSRSSRDDDSNNNNKRKMEATQQHHHQQHQQHQQQQQQQVRNHADPTKFVKVETDSSKLDKRPPVPPQASTQQQQAGVKSSSSAGKSKIEGPPIILVPNASQTLLNTLNAKEFLEDAVYHVADAKSKKPDSVIIIHRKIGRDNPVKYEVRDKPAALSSKDWERVVAVFVLGKEWQFKDWPFKDHVEIFNKIMGVYLRFEDDSMESVKVVMQWNVRIISLSKHKRHQDRTAVLEFWDKLDAFIRARRLPIVF